MNGSQQKEWRAIHKLPEREKAMERKNAIHRLPERRKRWSTL